MANRHVRLPTDVSRWVIMPRRASLLGPVAPDPVDGCVVNTGGKEGADPVGVPDARRPLEPSMEQVDDHVFRRGVVSDIAARKSQHLRSIALINKADRLRLPVTQNTQQLLVAVR